MRKTIRVHVIILSLVLLAPACLLADDLSDADHLLCTAAQTMVCSAAGECVVAPPWELNIPQFIEVDLQKKTLSTTKASGESRTTPIKNLERDEGIRAEPCERYPWDGVRNLGLFSELKSSVVVGVY